MLLANEWIISTEPLNAFQFKEALKENVNSANGLFHTQFQVILRWTTAGRFLSWIVGFNFYFRLAEKLGQTRANKVKTGIANLH